MESPTSLPTFLYTHMAGRHPYDDEESDSDDPDLLRALEESRSVTMICYDVPCVPKYGTYKLEFGGTQQKQTCSNC